MRGAVVYHVSVDTNIHVEVHSDADYVVLTTIVRGEPVAAVLYTVGELQTFLHHITEKMGAVKAHE